MTKPPNDKERAAPSEGEGPETQADRAGHSTSGRSQEGRSDRGHNPEEADTTDHMNTNDQDQQVDEEREDVGKDQQRNTDETPMPSEEQRAALLAKGMEEIQQDRLQHLIGSIKDAQSLLAFSAEANIALPESVVAGITMARDTFGTDAWSQEIESAFWAASREAAGLLEPVTSDSLKCVAARGKTMALVFFGLGIVSLALLVLAQVFWVYINNTSTQIQSSIQALNKKTAEAVELDGTVLLLNPASETGASDVDLGTTTPEEIQRIEEEDKQRQQLRVQLEGQSFLLKEEIEQLERVLAAQYVILASWVPEFAGDPKPSDPGWYHTQKQKEALESQMQAWEARRASEREFEKDYLLAQAASILSLMSTYVLPLLYGGLGTIAYILRSVSRSIRERILTSSAILNYWVRIPLGMLSGVAIGWFLTTDTLPTGWESVQPLALAFVAGYSVELIFTAMDRLVGAFSGKHQPATT